jgi:hypothetical protein
MGQLVNDQAYPFELIKNKTLQFLAKSLPILKSEYETIPKVARYLPANQLLNPTSLQSPLGYEHFHALNQLEHQSASELYGALPQPAAPPFMRRKKRSLTGARQTQQASITVAELMPNASLVVSSAHSAGRIGGHAARSVDGQQLASGQQPFAMIIKDGHRPPATGSSGSSSPSPSSPSSSSGRSRGQRDEQQQQQHKSATVQTTGVAATGGQQQSGQTSAPQLPRSHAANQLDQSQQSDTILARSGEQHHASHSMPAQTSESKATNSDGTTGGPANQRQPTQQQPHLLARSVPRSADDANAGNSQQQSQRSKSLTAAGRQQAAGSGPPQTPLKCANVNGLLLYT